MEYYIVNIKTNIATCININKSQNKASCKIIYTV